MEKKLRLQKMLIFITSIIISVLIISLLIGQKEGTSAYNPETNTTYENNQLEEERFYTSEESEYILVDRKTNCKYLNNSEKITPLLDSSGKPDCK